jgi:mannitol-1-/sugar-/sorbitol-6-phosphatase
VSGVLLDMDGTLVDSTVVVEAMWSEFAATYGLDPGVLVPASHGRQTLDTIREFLPDRTAAAQEGLEREFTAQEVRRTDGILEIAGAADLLDALGALRVPLAVVTSASRELATARMRAARVPVPGVLVTPEDIQRGKPDPEGYLLAAERINVPIADCVVFEDAEAGIAAAVASGAQVVVVGLHESARTAGLARVPDLRGITIEPGGEGFRLRG